MSYNDTVTADNLRNTIRLKIEDTLKAASLQSDDLRNCYRLKEILGQLRDVGWSSVTDCDADFNHVTLAYSAGDEKLLLKLTLPPDFPTAAPICDDGLPETFDLVSML